MPHTIKQYAIFNIPVSPTADISPTDAWLFSDPINTFDLGTPEKEVFNTYQTARNRGPRLVGQGKIASRLILKVRHVHFTDYVKVIGADAVKQEEEE